jgi:uncharacterized MAPEG superfamily protein
MPDWLNRNFVGLNCVLTSLSGDNNHKETRMTATFALIAFTAWTILLVGIVAVYRVVRGMGGVRFDAWSRNARTAKDPGLMLRIEHAHANCVENLPLFAAIVLAASITQHLDQIAGMASIVFYARLAQSAAHFTGTGQLNVLVRAGFWCVQLAMFVMMILKITS